MISADRQAQILRYYHVEKWRINTIAAQLRVHHTTVQRVLAQAGLPRAEIAVRASAVDAFVPMIVQTLERFPTLTAARLYGMAREGGYAGSASHFRHRVALLRPRRRTEAYLRLRTLPGEQAQVDWGHFGHLVVGRARRPLMAEALAREVPHSNAVRLAIERRREARAAPPVAVTLPEHLRRRDVIVRTHRLASYDALQGSVDDDAEHRQ